jgi:hypothetical protein
VKNLAAKAQSVTIKFEDGFEVCIMLDLVKGVQHPQEEQFVMLNVPIFTSAGSGHLTLTPRHIESFMKSGLIREAHRWLTRKH